MCYFDYWLQKSDFLPPLVEQMQCSRIFLITSHFTIEAIYQREPSSICLLSDAKGSFCTSTLVIARVISRCGELTGPPEGLCVSLTLSLSHTSKPWIVQAVRMSTVSVGVG